MIDIYEEKDIEKRLKEVREVQQKLKLKERENKKDNKDEEDDAYITATRRSIAVTSILVIVMTVNMKMMIKIFMTSSRSPRTIKTRGPCSMTTRWTSPASRGQ